MVRPGARVLMQILSVPNCCEASCHRVNAAFRRYVVQHERYAFQNRVRPHINYLTVFLWPKNLNGGPAHQQHATHVDRLHLVPQLDIDLVKRLRLQRTEHRRVVDQDMQPAKFRDDVIDQFQCRGLVADIAIKSGNFRTAYF